MKADGMHFFAPPSHQGRASASTYGMDPDGNWIELMEIKDPSIPYRYVNRHLDRLKNVAEEQF